VVSFTPIFLQVQARDFLVQLLRQDVDLGLVGVLVGPQVDLRERLVGERVRHHEARVAGGAAQVHESAFGQQEDRTLPSLKVYLSTCGLMFKRTAPRR
jgi:hypothetical protein